MAAALLLQAACTVTGEQRRIAIAEHPEMVAATAATPAQLTSRPDDPALLLAEDEAQLGRLLGTAAGMFTIINPHADDPSHPHRLGTTFIDPRHGKPRGLPARFLQLLAFHTTLTQSGSPGDIYVTRHTRSAYTKDEFNFDFQITSFIVGRTPGPTGQPAPCNVVGYTLSPLLRPGISVYFEQNPLPILTLMRSPDAAWPGMTGMSVLCPNSDKSTTGYRIAASLDHTYPHLANLGTPQRPKYLERWFTMPLFTVKRSHMKMVEVEHFTPWNDWSEVDLWQGQ